MSTDLIGMKKTLFEASFGSVSRKVGTAIEALLRIDRIIGLAYIIEGKLYGTSLLAMRRDQPDPPRIILEHFIHLVGTSLQRKKAEVELKKKMVELLSVNKELEQFAHANAELEQFAFIASHNLQQPLRTISNYMQIFEEDYSDKIDDKAREYLLVINDAAKRMISQLDSLLDFSRLGRNLKLSKVDCNKIINNVLADLETMIVASDASIEVSNMPELNVYESEFSQLFQNLIVNAIKFQKPDSKPKIKISSEKSKTKWKFSINDNGIGISSRSFHKIFDIFQRLHKDAEYEGHGIGLAFCKKIVELHKGNIWVESTVGQGTTFYFTIANLTE
jgi:light-regulated signal transduction histidine kinase (bacteriophytochrome)